MAGWLVDWLAAVDQGSSYSSSRAVTINLIPFYVDVLDGSSAGERDLGIRERLYCLWLLLVCELKWVN